MVDEWFEARAHAQTVALVTATHAEAQAIGEAIQSRRLYDGTIRSHRSSAGQDGQVFYEGDIIQTRRNNTAAGVDNRDSWTVLKISADEIYLGSTADSTVFRKISKEYAEASVHLGYATTVYGIQGETTDRSLVGPGVDAAGLYVGLTRGRVVNEVVVTAPTSESAQRELIEIMQRNEIEETVDSSREAAQRELRLSAQVPDSSGPVTENPMASGLGRSL
jgi:ATP-dependent exoDNAse (exonuclease V) alpha subunit